jgi:hypothetical protein
MITNIFYCKPNIKCKTFESYRLKRREELMNKIDKPEHEIVCNFEREKALEEDSNIYYKKFDSTVEQLRTKVNDNFQKVGQNRIRSSLEGNKEKDDKEKTSLNFINKNDAITQQTHFVDDRYGHRQEVIKIRNKKKLISLTDKNDYILKEIQANNFDNNCKDSNESRALMKLDQDTICSLLENLSQKFLTLYKSYISIHFSNSIRKKKLEKELLEIDSLIDLLENNINIYIKND